MGSTSRQSRDSLKVRSLDGFARKFGHHFSNINAGGQRDLFKKSEAWKIDLKLIFSAANVSLAPSPLSTIETTSSTSAPASRQATTANIADAPLVVTSSMTTSFLPLKFSFLAGPSTRFLEPCSLAVFRTKKPLMGVFTKWLYAQTAPVMGTAPISKPPT